MRRVWRPAHLVEKRGSSDAYFVALAGLFPDRPQILLAGGAVFFLFRQIMYDTLAFEMPRKRLPATRSSLRGRTAGIRGAGIIVGIVGRLRFLCCRGRLPRLPCSRKQC